MDPDRFTPLAELAVYGANVQPGQTVIVSGDLEHAPLARAVAAAAYDRGAQFVDVGYFDPHVKRARVEHADPETIEFVPSWYGQRMLEHADGRGARVTIGGPTVPGLLDDLDPELTGRDRLPFLPEVPRIISERTTNWCIVPCPHPVWATLVYPELPGDKALEKLWADLEHVLRLDTDDPGRAWDERMTALNASGSRLTERRFDAIELRGEGTELRIGMLAGHRWVSAEFVTRDGVRHIANLPTEEIFTSPDPARAEGHVTSTKPLVLRDGSIISGLRVRFEGGRAVEISADARADALRSLLAVDDGGIRLGEVALVDRGGRIGPLGTVFYDTLLDENAASHLALGGGFSFAVDDDVERVNRSGAHVDFMVGSPELEVDGITASGERVPVMRQGDWQI
ncbi:MAG TPA: aminopeptidase [Gaiellaceae bacterium]